MTPDLYADIEPRGAPVDSERCEWAIRRGLVGHQNAVRQCSRKVRERIDGHGYCHPHAKMVSPTVGAPVKVRKVKARERQFGEAVARDKGL